MTVFNVLVSSAYLLVAGIFIVAAWHKLADTKHFQKVLDDYAILPAGLVKILAPVLPLVELLTAGLLSLSTVLPEFSIAGLGLALLLLAAYTFALLTLFLQGRALEDCGCGGSANQPLGVWPVLRNVSLVIICLILLSGNGVSVFVPNMSFVAIGLFVVFSLVYWIVDGLMKNSVFVTVLEKHYD
jgi:hypothetical protein